MSLTRSGGVVPGARDCMLKVSLVGQPVCSAAASAPAQPWVSGLSAHPVGVCATCGHVGSYILGGGPFILLFKECNGLEFVKRFLSGWVGRRGGVGSMWGLGTSHLTP